MQEDGLLPKSTLHKRTLLPFLAFPHTLRLEYIHLGVPLTSQSVNTLWKSNGTFPKARHWVGGLLGDGLRSSKARRGAGTLASPSTQRCPVSKDARVSGQERCPAPPACCGVSQNTVGLSPPHHAHLPRRGEDAHPLEQSLTVTH